MVALAIQPSCERAVQTVHWVQFSLSTVLPVILCKDIIEKLEGLSSPLLGGLDFVRKVVILTEVGSGFFFTGFDLDFTGFWFGFGGCRLSVCGFFTGGLGCSEDGLGWMGLFSGGFGCDGLGLCSIGFISTFS